MYFSSMYKNWDFLLSEFRRLGGIADNICQREGDYGRGIFPVDSTLRSRIFTPSRLMIKKEDVYLEDNKIRIRQDKEYDQELRKFFNFYQDNFSWSYGGKEITENFEKGLSLFNGDLKQLIKNNTLFDLEQRHQGNWDEVVKEQFLKSRVVSFGKDQFIAPIWELVNHKVKSLPFIISEKGISTPNYPSINCELRHSYGNTGPLNRFFSYGFFSPETIVFSFPFTMTDNNKSFHISCKGKCLNDDSMKIERSNNQITLEGLPIADSNNCKLVMDYFEEIRKRIGEINLSKDFLLRIFELNIEKRNNIISESTLVDNKVSKMLTKTIQYEISLILSESSNCKNL